MTATRISPISVASESVTSAYMTSTSLGSNYRLLKFSIQKNGMRVASIIPIAAPAIMYLDEIAENDERVVASFVCFKSDWTGISELTVTFQVTRVWGGAVKSCLSRYLESRWRHDGARDYPAGRSPLKDGGRERNNIGNGNHRDSDIVGKDVRIGGGHKQPVWNRVVPISIVLTDSQPRGRRRSHGEHSRNGEGELRVDTPRLGVAA